MYYGFRNKYSLDESFRFNGKFIQLYGDGIIQAGAGSYIGSFSTAYSHKNNKVIIGKGVRISHNVRIYTLSSFPDQDFSNPQIQNKAGDVIIGDYSWIGANVFINPGINIGSNAVVGANSVVTKDVPDFAIVGGVPATLIRMKKIDQKL
ncbi:MAG: acyltransferase [Niastella sp.]|nr:acyltransferase [Niastella sp.]